MPKQQNDTSNYKPTACRIIGKQTDSPTRPPLGFSSTVRVKRIGANTFTATTDNCCLTRAEVLVVDVTGETGGASTPNHFIYPRMFPFYEDGIVVFCNTKCQSVQLAFCLHSFFDSYGRLPRTRREAIIGHILKAVFPVEWKHTQNELFKQAPLEKKDADDGTVEMDIEN